MQKFLLYSWNVLTTTDWLQLTGIIIISIFTAAIYPAFILSGFQPAKVLKSSGITSSDSGRVRRALITVQFILSLTLIVWIFTAAKQMDFLMEHPLGFNQDMKLVIRDSEVFDSLYRRHVATFRTEVVRIPGVRNMTYIETLPGDAVMLYANSVRRLKADTTEASALNFCGVDEQFADVLKLTKKAGELFTESTPKYDVVITTSAAKLLGYKDVNDAVNDELLFRDDTVLIKGVIEDFFFNAPKQAIQPMIFQYNRTAGYYYVIDLESQDTKAVIEAVEKLFRSEFTGQPFEYFFLDEHYNKQYATEADFQQSLFFLTIVSILLTCVGLTAMSFYTAIMRKKEIGIRKTFGASSGSVVVLLIKQYLKLVGIASLVALPVAFYLCTEWLNAFVVKIELSAWTFVIPLLTLVLITLAAVSAQTLRAALKNPVDSLYHE
jgi:putative ABC transport system permease protein